LKNKALYLAILSLISLIFVLRYPLSNHYNISGDAVSYPYYSLEIINTGSIWYILNPLSYFGKYAFSVASGTPVFIASFMLATDLSIDPTLLIYSFFHGVVSVLGMFILIRQYVRNQFAIIFGILCFVLNKYFLLHAMYTLHFRTSIAILIPFFLWSLLRTYNTRKITYFSCLILLFLSSTSMHRLSAFIIPALVFPLLLTYLWKRKGEDYLINNRILPNKIILNHFIGLSILLLFLFSIYSPSIFDNIGIRVIATGDIDNNRIDLGFLNPVLGVANYYVSTGLLQFLTIVGAFSVIYHRGPRSIESTFLLFLLFSHSFLLVNAQYFSPVAITLISILCGKGILAVQIQFKKMDKESFFAAFSSTLILVSTVYAAYLVEINVSSYDDIYSENNLDGVGRHVPDETFNAALWRNEFMDYNDRTITNAPEAFMLGFYGTNLRSMTDISLLESSKKIWIETMGIDLRPAIDVIFNIRETGDYYGTTTSFGAEGYGRGDGHESILYLEPESNTYIETFELVYVIETKIDYGEESISYPFYENNEYNKYKIFINEFVNIYHYKSW